MLLTKSSSLNIKFLIYFFIILFFSSVIIAEDKPVDIWATTGENKNKNKVLKDQNLEKKSEIDINKIENEKKEISILESNSLSEEIKLVGLYEPEKNDFNLNMWTNTDGEVIKNTLDRIEKIQLSEFSEEIFIKTIFTYSYSPENKLDSKEFLKLKIDWLIKNDKVDLIEEFLNNNLNFFDKSRLIKYLVDFYISSANLEEGCKKANFINKEIKDDYLEKFRIYCLIFNKKKDQAQLNFDLLREQGRSNKFFDDKIMFLLGMQEKTSKKILDNNLLNFYLSSITIEDFKYEPNSKTDKNIWKFLNASNLISAQYVEDEETMARYETAANEGTFDYEKIFEIYKSVPFNLNQLINADNIYKSLNGYEARALIYQKIMLSDNFENKLNLLFLLQDLFKKNNLENVYKNHLSDKLKEINPQDIPKDYVKIVEKNILSDEESILGKIKYDDSVLHRSKVIKIFTEEKPNKQKIEKDFLSVYKKIKRNNKYFYSIKDIILLETLSSDGIEIPKELNLENLSKDLTVPSNMIDLAENGEIGLLMLKLVEIIGSDDIRNLDPETLYFINRLLNRGKIKKVRNQILNLTLPLRV